MRRSEGSRQVAEKLCIVRRNEKPAAHQAWAAFRKYHLNARFVPETYSVPTEWPPETDLGISAYMAFVENIREEIRR